MSALASILIPIATRAGATVVKSILEKHVGGAASDLGGTVIDAIAGKVGVTPEDLGTVPVAQVEAAVRDVEGSDIIAAYVEGQRETNKLMLAEMDKESSFGWLWRPAGMWLMLACIAWYIFVVPLLNALAGQGGITLVVPFSDFVPIFMTFAGLYMGGNTLIRAVKK